MKNGTGKSFIKWESGPTVAHHVGSDRDVQIRRHEGGTVVVSRRGYRPLVLRSKKEQEAFFKYLADAQAALALKGEQE